MNSKTSLLKTDRLEVEAEGEGEGDTIVSIPSQECADCRKKLAASLQSQKSLEATNKAEDDGAVTPPVLADSFGQSIRRVRPSTNRSLLASSSPLCLSPFRTLEEVIIGNYTHNHQIVT